MPDWASGESDLDGATQFWHSPQRDLGRNRDHEGQSTAYQQPGFKDRLHWTSQCIMADAIQHHPSRTSSLPSGTEEDHDIDEKGGSDPASEDASSESDDTEDESSLPSDVGASIDLDALKCAKKAQHPVLHRAQAERSILALVVDDDYLIGGLEGGDIVVG